MTPRQPPPVEDDYFVIHKLYPNVDFYSGIIYQAMGFPVEMFPVLFAVGRTAGWLAQWEEVILDRGQKITRPRQLLRRRTGTSPQRPPGSWRRPFSSLLALSSAGGVDPRDRGTDPAADGTLRRPHVRATVPDAILRRRDSWAAAR
jgi:hypothetical protein